MPECWDTGLYEVSLDDDPVRGDRGMVTVYAESLVLIQPGPHSSKRRSGTGQIEGGADDGIGVDAVVAVEVLDRAGLAELRHPQRRVRHTVDGGQEGQRVRVPVQDGDQRGGAVRRERLTEDPGRFAGPWVEALARAQGLDTGTGEPTWILGQA